MHQDCVLHRSTSNFLSQRIIVRGTVPHVLEIKIAIRFDVRFRIFRQARAQSRINDPIRVVDRHMTCAIAMTLEKSAHVISFHGRVAFLQHWKAKNLPKPIEAMGNRSSRQMSLSYSAAVMLELSERCE